jgi:hypothetical protein
METGAVDPTGVVHSDDPPPPPTITLPTPPLPETKTCPDCAEEVRFAARKCRFCGFRFEPSEDANDDIP